MTIVQQAAAVVAPWATFYGNSRVAETLVTFGHFGGMMTAGGFALSADRATLKAEGATGDQRLRQLHDLRAVHPIVVGALVVTSISGLLMFAADLENLAVMPAFWVKLALVVVLLANGALMLNVEKGLERVAGQNARGWRQLRYASVASLLLWFAVVLVGSFLPNAG